jgi:hypothetical protein
MSNKNGSLLSWDQVVELLKKSQGSMSNKDFAKKLKISLGYLSDIYHKRRTPGPPIRELLGVEDVVMYRKVK